MRPTQRSLGWLGVSEAPSPINWSIRWTPSIRGVDHINHDDLATTATGQEGAVARRLRATVHELYGYPADVRFLKTDRRTSTSYLLRVLTWGHWGWCSRC